MRILRDQIIPAILIIAGLVFLNSAAASGKNANGLQPGKPESDTAKSILFIGNSLTYTNDLPGIFARIGINSGINLKTEMAAYPNYALEDHWNDGKIQLLIATGHYDFVIIQQGPSSQNEGRTMLLDYGSRIKTLCDTHHARLAFFMVWPALSNFYNFDGVIKNYTDAATTSHSLLCPVGQVWKDHFLKTGDYSYYGPDGFHPSVKGSESAARIIFETLFNKNSNGK